MTELCVWCGKNEVTEEHIWPRWVSRDLYAGRLPLEHRLSDDHTEYNRWCAPGLCAVTESVCDHCNGGWMSRLETRVKKLALPMMRDGTRTELKTHDQMTLAVWTAKTAMMFALLHPQDEGIPPENYGILFDDHTKPPPGTMVWLGRFDPDVPGEFYKYRTLWPGGTQRDARAGRGVAYVSSFTVGEMFFVAFGHAINEYPAVEEDKIGMVRVWPKDRRGVTWPPPLTYSFDGFLSITDAFANGALS